MRGEVEGVPGVRVASSRRVGSGGKQEMARRVAGARRARSPVLLAQGQGLLAGEA